MSGDHSQEKSDMLTLREAIRRAAPTPPDGLQARIGARILQSAESDLPRKSGQTSRRIAIRRAAALLIGMLIVGTGAAFAISTVLQQFIAQDHGLEAIIAQGRGHEIGLSQTIDGFSVTLAWAYADDNRLTLAYTILGQQGAQYTNLYGGYSLTDAMSGAEIPLIEGWNALLDSNGALLEAGAPPVGDRSISVYSYDLGAVPLEGRTSLDLRLEGQIEAITLQKRTQMPMDRFDEMKEGPDEPFVFSFSVPLDGEQRVLNTPLITTDNDIPLTLQRVTVTPSQVRLVLCLMPPASDRKWTAIPHLTTNGSDVAGGGAVSDIANVGEAAGQTCMQYLYNAGMYDYRGEWRLEITELVGFGSGGGNDQQRITGSWTFEFTVP